MRRTLPTNMQSQAFVDTLNMMAAVSGTSAWEYRAGDYPVPTGRKADISDWLAGGSGTKDDPFRVETKEQLKHIADMVNHGWDFRGQYIRLDADIDLNPPFEEWGTTMPVQWMPIGRFTSEESPNGATEFTYFFRGTFDGNFHGINNMYINNSVTDGYQGLFGALSNNATIKNLSINDVWMYGHGAIGIVTGYIHRFGSGILISQVNTSGTVESNWGAGGISGSVPLEGNFKVLNSCSSANLKAVTYARPVGADQNYVDTQPGDTIANFFYTGILEGQSSRNQGTFGKEPSINCYFDSTVFHWTDEYARSKEYMQSKEFVNELNYFVAKYNARTGVEPLSYWQWNESGYPTWTDEVPPHTVYYNSHGGTAIAPQPALDDSRVHNAQEKKKKCELLNI